MKYWNRYGETGGFSETPREGSVEITDEYWMELLNAQSDGGYAIASNADGYPVIVLPAQTADQIRSTRDRLIAETRWRIERHADEVAMGITPSEDITPVLQYIQSLRDITKQPGFPASVLWPEL